MQHVFSLFIRARERTSRLTATHLPIFSILSSDCRYQPPRAGERTTDAAISQEPFLNANDFSLLIRRFTTASFFEKHFSDNRQYVKVTLTYASLANPSSTRKRSFRKCHECGL